jgi:hypothetical protein
MRRIEIRIVEREVRSQNVQPLKLREKPRRGIGYGAKRIGWMTVCVFGESAMGIVKLQVVHLPVTFVQQRFHAWILRRHWPA